MANRTVWIGGRYTEEESTIIREHARETHLNLSDYVRRKALWLPQEMAGQLDELNYEVHKIGVNINQVVRSCNSKNFVSKEDYRKLTRYLEQINENYCELIKELKRQNEQQFHMEMILKDPYAGGSAENSEGAGPWGTDDTW